MRGREREKLHICRINTFSHTGLTHSASRAYKKQPEDLRITENHVIITV